HQQPTTKHQRSSKSQAPKLPAGFWAVATDIGSRTRAMTTSKFRSENLELGIWSFSGSWMLVVGCFHVVAASACPDGVIVRDASFGVVLTFQRSFISVT